MKLEIIKIIDRGVAGKERLWLRVLAECDLSYFIVFDTVYTSQNSISNIQKNAYWFNSKKVKTGDYVILYTGRGTPSISTNNDGTINHFLYWGNDKTIWNKQGDCAVLFELNSWMTSKFE
ncbi:MAG: hypothetical protein PHR83_12430 [Paludibacter sp.]|nr:hypothetical protein [Paludibacter sp.]